MADNEDLAAPAPDGPDSSGREVSSPRPRGVLQRLKASWANPAHRFVMLFLPYLAVVAFAYPKVVRSYNPIVQSFILLTAKLEYWLFAIFSDSIKIHDKLVTFGGFGVKIIDECTGIYEMLIFSAAVFAFPTPWKQKALGILIGNPLIYLFNVIRIAILIVVGRYAPAFFDFTHIYFMQATMIVMITTVWLLWIIVVVRLEEDAPHTSA